MLIATLDSDVYLDTWTLQVVEPNESGQTFALGSARSWRGVVEQELAAQGESRRRHSRFF